MTAPKANKVQKHNIVKVFSGFDFTLLICLMVIMAFGIVILYSASSYRHGDAYLKSQVMYTGIALFFMLAVILIDYHVWFKFNWTYYFMAIISIMLIKVFPANTKYGALRSIKVGPFTISVVELAKTFMILFLCSALCRTYNKVRKSFPKVIQLFVMTGFVSALVAIVNNNMSSAIIILGIAFVLLFMVYDKSWLFLLVIPIIVAVYMWAVWFGRTHEIPSLETTITDDNGNAVVLDSGSGESISKNANVRFARIIAWQDPEKYAEGKGFQPLQALYAIGSGGYFGKRLGNGTIKNTIPEAQNDMAYSIICEELGFVGSVGIIIIYLILIWRIVRVAIYAEDLYGSLLAAAVAAHIAIQVILHIAVNTNTIPNTGVTLPFISAGGSALIATFIEIGLVVSVSMRIRMGGEKYEQR